MKRLRKKNQGSALVLVICTISVLSVIGSLLLVRTTNNRKMKEAEKRAQETFNIAENGSLEFVSALEMIAQEAIKSSFSDLLMQYGSVSTDEERMNRFNDIFVKMLENTLNTSDAAQELMKKALSSDDDILEDLEVSFGSFETDGTNVASTSKKTSKITIRDAVFTYKDGAGNQTTIKTDITVVADIPDVKKGMAAGVAAAYEDFILITNGNVSRTLGTDVDTPTSIDGNVYIAKDFIQKNDGATTFKNTIKKLEVKEDGTLVYNTAVSNPYKLLIKGAVDIKGASSKVNVDNGTDVTSGFGLWVENIRVDNGASFMANSNCYAKDDLTVSGKNTKVTVSGGEYIGYSGETTRLSEKNSAIMINKAEDITIDFSGTDMLILRGSSYIQDKVFGNATFATEQAKADNLLGVLQGESVAYKDMQSIYLVPSSCTAFGKNPVDAQEFKDADQTISLVYTFKNDSGDSATLNLADYVKASEPYIKRYVRLDGGTSEYVYLYLNFKDEEAAAKYQKDFLATWKGTEIRNQLKNLKSSKIKLTSSGKNYTISNMIEYDGISATTSIKNIYPDGASFTMPRGKCNNASRQYNGLFSALDASVTKVIPAGYDLIQNAVLKEGVLSGSNVSTSSDGAIFIFENGSKSTSGMSINNKKGIVIINGDLTIDSQLYFDGLIIVTGNVNIKVTDIKLKSDELTVRKLLGNDTVKAFFRGQDDPGVVSSGGGYVSSESVTIKFENWNKN